MTDKKDELSETDIQTPCGDIILHMGYCEDDKTVIIKAGKGGSCRHIMWEVIAKLLSETPHKKAIEVMRHYQCDKAIVGKQSCFDLIAKWLIKKDIK